MSAIAMKDAVIFISKYLFLPLHTNEKRLAPGEVPGVPFFGFSFFFLLLTCERHLKETLLTLF